MTRTTACSPVILLAAVWYPVIITGVDNDRGDGLRTLKISVPCWIAFHGVT
jgi:hypothetical protein